MGITEKVVIDGREWTVEHTSKDDTDRPVEQATAAPGELRETLKRRRPWFSYWRSIR
jgi:hypothetical protein